MGRRRGTPEEDRAAASSDLEKEPRHAIEGDARRKWERERERISIWGFRVLNYIVDLGHESRGMCTVRMLF